MQAVRQERLAWRALSKSLPLNPVGRVNCVGWREAVVGRAPRLCAVGNDGKAATKRLEDPQEGDQVRFFLCCQDQAKPIFIEAHNLQQCLG